MYSMLSWLKTVHCEISIPVLIAVSFSDASGARIGIFCCIQQPGKQAVFPYKGELSSAQ